LKSKKVPFKIEHIDPLGQGVSKIGEAIAFIAKTLPGEEGEALIFKEKKGVQFGQLIETNALSKISEQRISPLCPHFDKCPSCHFLHTDYETEKLFKTKSIQKLLGKSLTPEDLLEKLTYHPAPERINYRNRIQLHYDIKEGLLGYLNGFFETIIPVPNCRLGSAQISQKLLSLYENNSWKKLISPSSQKKGHIEIYERINGKVEISVNQHYSKGGFTQVNQEMNILLKETIKTKYDSLFSSPEKMPIILDLFGGNGNLSEDLQPSKSYVVDNYPNSNNKKSSHQFFLKENLFGKKALENLKAKLKQEEVSTIEMILLDPPRSGLKSINEFCNEFKSPFLFYVSCNPSTLARDLLNIKESYEIKEVHLFDFFPSTYHFETLVIAEKKR
jgi:23S rRNA (uracil1939-C5)-methyltransferase